MSELAHNMPEPLPLVPPLALAVFIACVAGAGALANCSVLAALFKTSRNGLLSIIIQLALADFTLLSTSIGPELWSFNARTWNFGKEGCIAYRGLNVFASTACSYLIATIALHTLATINVEEKAVSRRIKRNNQDEDEEIRSSRHSLVASSDSSTPPRTMNVDYRLTHTKVPVAQPTIFVWILSVSLSVPEFTLATIVNLDHNNVLCTSLNSNHRLHMYTILALFNLFLPTALMSTAGVLVLVKLNSKKRMCPIDICDSIAALQLSLWLIVVYIVMCAPRSIATAYHIYTSVTGTDSYSIEKAQNADMMTLLSLLFSSAYLGSTLIRPILCIILLPRLRKVFSFSSRDTVVDNV